MREEGQKEEERGGGQRDERDAGMRRGRREQVEKCTIKLHVVFSSKIMGVTCTVSTAA